MFTVYIDELIKELQNAGVGCYIGHEYYGCLGYADDLKILSAGIKSLQRMVDICFKFGQHFSVKYNAKKTICIAFSRVKDMNLSLNETNRLMLDGTLLEWKSWIKDLGNYVSFDLSEKLEMRKKRVDFISRVNGLLTQYTDVQPEVLMYLLNSYCCHFMALSVGTCVIHMWQLSIPHGTGL